MGVGVAKKDVGRCRADADRRKSEAQNLQATDKQTPGGQAWRRETWRWRCVLDDEMRGTITAFLRVDRGGGGWPAVMDLWATIDGVQAGWRFGCRSLLTIDHLRGVADRHLGVVYRSVGRWTAARGRSPAWRLAVWVVGLPPPLADCLPGVVLVLVES